jgi:hypothetical protein
MDTPDLSSLRALRGARNRIDRDHHGQIAIPALAAQAGYSRALHPGLQGRLRRDPGSLPDATKGGAGL